MKKIRNERGQSLVEMAVSIVILLLLLSGAVEFGMAFFQFIQLRDAVQEGALYGSLNPTDTSGITARVKGASNSPVDLNALTPTITFTLPDGSVTTNVGDRCEGNGITVRLTYNHQVFMPFMSGIVGNTLPLNASVTNTILTPVCP
jgi:Flp pilus assembly protein TadG